MTGSEKLFEEFCAQRGFSFERIVEGQEQSPDYRVRTSQGDVICEVKQFEPNAEERAASRAPATGEQGVVVSTTQGGRVRSAISRANPQLKALTQGKLPGVVVTCDLENLMHGGADNIRVAMYGSDAVVFAVPHDPAMPPYVKDLKAAGGRSMTEEHSTSISAVADLRRVRDSAPEIDIYHNRFAAVALPRTGISGPGVRHFRLREKEPGKFDDWEEI